MTPEIVLFRSDVPLERWPDFPESEISSGTRASVGHRYVEDKPNGLSAGVWEAEANLGRWMKWPVHEFMVIVEGEVVMVEEDCETVVVAGECFFIPKGRRCIWNQSGYAKKFMVIFDDKSGLRADGTVPIFKINPSVEKEYFRDATRQLSVGVRQTSNFHQSLTAAAAHQLLHVLEGTVALTDETGKCQVFKPGDTFVVPAGKASSWKNDGVLHYVYCSFEPRLTTTNRT